MNAPNSRKTVLIVEDEKNIVDILRFNLQRAGYETLEAYDGAEGLSLAPVPLGECQSWLAARFSEKGPEELRLASLDCQGILGRAVRRLEDGLSSLLLDGTLKPGQQVVCRERDGSLVFESDTAQKTP